MVYTGLGFLPEEVLGNIRFIYLGLEWEMFGVGPIPTRID